MKQILQIALFLFCVAIGIDTVIAKARQIHYASDPNPEPVNGIHYQKVNGVQGIVIDGTYHILQCSIKGWKEQDQYINHNLPIVAEGCMVY